MTTPAASRTAARSPSSGRGRAQPVKRLQKGAARQSPLSSERAPASKPALKAARAGGKRTTAGSTSVSGKPSSNAAGKGKARKAPAAAGTASSSRGKASAATGKASAAAASKRKRVVQRKGWLDPLASAPLRHPRCRFLAVPCESSDLHPAPAPPHRSDIRPLTAAERVTSERKLSAAQARRWKPVAAATKEFVSRILDGATS